ncbi:hypothetical protein WDZ16_07575 [Pseudokineococcus marinus]|uniref:alpha-amylase n=1 Tax=Pseudokineococcus marinus TaxID=351215 RepID=A0A849BQE8_9ACTN|nr:hypothetical protein [Pseudokineococcus marinus]NNH22754.1 hypothetical protein [Pseudokineococcus marinus]
MQQDEGFSLVEAVVAAMVLAIGAVAVASVLIGALDLSRGNSQRVQAAALMTAELEAARGVAVDDLPVGTTTRAVTQQGTTYTVERAVAWLSSGAGADACLVSTARTVTKTVGVTVTWPAMGRTQPVRGDTQLSPGPTSPALTGQPGAVAVVVAGADGAGVLGVQITLVGPTPSTATRTATTSSTGCASFPDAPAGTYLATASLSGYVAPTQAAAALTGSFTVVPGRVARPRTTLDRSGAITVTTTAPSTTPAGVQRTGMPLTLDAPFSVPTTRRLYPSCATVPAGSADCLQEGPGGTTHRATALFPGTYQVRGCSSSTAGGVSVVVLPGGSPTATLPFGTAVLQGPNSGSGALPATVYVRPGTGSACAGAATLAISTSSGTALPLPDGPWQFSRYESFSSSAATTVTAGQSVTVTVPT